MKKVLADDATKKDTQAIKEREPVEIRSKMSHYSKLIQQTHRPNVSETKRREVEAHIQMFPNTRNTLLRDSTERKSMYSDVSL